MLPPPPPSARWFATRSESDIASRTPPSSKAETRSQLGVDQDLFATPRLPESATCLRVVYSDQGWRYKSVESIPVPCGLARLSHGRLGQVDHRFSGSDCSASSSSSNCKPSCRRRN